MRDPTTPKRSDSDKTQPAHVEVRFFFIEWKLSGRGGIYRRDRKVKPVLGLNVNNHSYQLITWFTKTDILISLRTHTQVHTWTKQQPPPCNLLDREGCNGQPHCTTYLHDGSERHTPARNARNFSVGRSPQTLVLAVEI